MGSTIEHETTQYQNVGDSQPITINVAKDYCMVPGGRYPGDGPGNGTDFRINHLLPVLENHQRAIIELDGTVGYSASFLDEAFGGLVKKHGYDANTILDAFEFKTSKKMFDVVKLIKKYIMSANHSGNNTFESGPS